MPLLRAHTINTLLSGRRVLLCIAKQVREAYDWLTDRLTEAGETIGNWLAPPKWMIWEELMMVGRTRFGNVVAVGGACLSASVCTIWAITLLFRFEWLPILVLGKPDGLTL